MILFSAIGVAAAIVIGVIIFLVSSLFPGHDDAGIIQNNVYAAGVSLRGKNEAEAKAALHKATDAFWMIQFAVDSDEAEAAIPDFFTWAKSVSFSA